MGKLTVELHIFHGKHHGFRCRSSLEPIQQVTVKIIIFTPVLTGKSTMKGHFPIRNIKITLVKASRVAAQLRWGDFQVRPGEGIQAHAAATASESLDHQNRRRGVPEMDCFFMVINGDQWCFTCEKNTVVVKSGD